MRYKDDRFFPPFVERLDEEGIKFNLNRLRWDWSPTVIGNLFYSKKKRLEVFSWDDINVIYEMKFENEIAENISTLQLSFILHEQNSTIIQKRSLLNSSIVNNILLFQIRFPNHSNGYTPGFLTTFSQFPNP